MFNKTCNVNDSERTFKLILLTNTQTQTHTGEQDLLGGGNDSITCMNCKRLSLMKARAIYCAEPLIWLDGTVKDCIYVQGCSAFDAFPL